VLKFIEEFQISESDLCKWEKKQSNFVYVGKKCGPLMLDSHYFFEDFVTLVEWWMLGPEKRLIYLANKTVFLDPCL